MVQGCLLPHRVHERPQAREHIQLPHLVLDRPGDREHRDAASLRRPGERDQLVIPYTLEANDMRFAVSPGWVTALDLPLIPGAGTIR